MICEIEKSICEFVSCEKNSNCVLHMHLNKYSD